MRLPIELPDLADLPQTTCRQCNKPKINGLFVPGELLSTYPRCRMCIGEINERHRANKTGQSRYMKEGRP